MNFKKHLHEKILNTKRIFKGQFLKIEQDEVQAPDGKNYFRETILHPGAAAIIPLLPNGNVMMLHQYRHALKKVFLEFPAGKRDPNEDTLTTAHRELLEETGYQAQKMKFLTSIHPVIGYSNEQIDLYLAEGLIQGEQKLDQGEFLELIEIHPKELMKLIFEGKVTDVKTQIAAFWLDKYLSGEWT